MLKVSKSFFWTVAYAICLLEPITPSERSMFAQSQNEQSYSMVEEVYSKGLDFMVDELNVELWMVTESEALLRISFEAVMMIETLDLEASFRVDEIFWVDTYSGQVLVGGWIDTILAELFNSVVTNPIGLENITVTGGNVDNPNGDGGGDE